MKCPTRKKLHQHIRIFTEQLIYRNKTSTDGYEKDMLSGLFINDP